MFQEIQLILKEWRVEWSFAYFAIKKNIWSSAELRTSFIASVVGMALNNTAFLIIWFTFGTIASGIGGWSPMDVFGMLGFSAIGYGICFAFFGGVSDLPEIVASGNFDKFLLNPKNTLLRLATSRVSVPALGDILFGAICLTVWFIYTSFSIQILLLAIILCLLSASFHFTYSVFANSFAFYVNDSRPLVHGIFELFITPSLMFGGAFQGMLRAFLLFVVPALFAGAFPVEVVKSMSLLKLFLIFFMSSVWFLISIKFFYRSLRKYESSNFINFG
jgi:ABC-2 type transport system permease protein